METPAVPAWRSVIAAEWAERRATETAAIISPPLFPLAANPFGEEEILAMTEVLLSGRLTMGENVERAEKEFATAVGAPYAVMVNSGSSANLLMLSAIMSRTRAVHCVPGDEVFVPAVCWSTSVAPLLQLGLVPVFVDADPCTFNVSLPALEAALISHPRARALMAVHVLGNSAEMGPLLEICRRHKLILLEDTCESLGSRAVLTAHDAVAAAVVAGIGSSPRVPEEPRMLGTFGSFGSFSFFFSHHITSGEGGMVVCQTEEDLNYLRGLRAHGWTRHLTNRFEVEARYPEIDSRFCFISLGYNFRPMEVQGAMLRVQLRKMEAFNACRRDNLARIEVAMSREPRFSAHMSFMKAAVGTDPAWFGVAIVLHRPFAHQLREYLEYLSKAGIENRPIISGNFVRQPMVAEALPHLRASDFPGAEVLHTRGFFIGVHQIRVSDADIEELVRVMLSFTFKPRRVVLVTGANGMLGRAIADEVKRLAATTSIMNATAPGASILTYGCGINARGGVELAASEADGIATEWVFATREDGDLSDVRAVESLFKRSQPTHVLHLAARLQSLNAMTARPVDFWLGNVSVNNNVLEMAHKFQNWCGPIRVVSVLSTVMFPRDATFPVDASQAEAGTLHPAGEAYALAKRSLAALSRWSHTQYGDDFLTVLPGNFFGAYGDFNAATAPLVNALIAKAFSAAEASPSVAAPLHIMGTGKPLRQVMHAPDLARILLWTLEHYPSPAPSAPAALPLLVAGPEHSISEIARMVADAAGFRGELTFDTNAIDGPLARTADASIFNSLCPDFTFTPLEQGIRATIEWYRTSRKEGTERTLKK